ncbi:hypothetical protein QZH41_016230, partial [Actinostola sp. cb2023]
DPEHIMKSNMSLQWALHDAMQTAKERGELVGGVHSAAEQLDEDANDIALCILVDTKRADPGIQIHCRLIEAFCWEFPIPVIKVNSSRKLMVLAGYSFGHPKAIHCILIKGNSELSPSLEKIIRYAKQGPAPLVKLT